MSLTNKTTNGILPTIDAGAFMPLALDDKPKSNITNFRINEERFLAEAENSMLIAINDYHAVWVSKKFIRANKFSKDYFSVGIVESFDYTTVFDTETPDTIVSGKDLVVLFTNNAHIWADK